MILKRIGPLSLARIFGVLYGIIGLALGCAFAIVAMLGGLATQETSGPIFGFVFGVGAVIFFPLIYGGLGFVMSLIMAGLYNLMAGWLGGIELELVQNPGGAGSGHSV
jgi:hypothetical protein